MDIAFPHMNNDYGIGTLEELSNAKKFNRWMSELFLKDLGHHILEIGCGIGNISRLLPKQAQILLTDYNEANESLIKKNLDFDENIQFDVFNILDGTKTKELSSQFDSIICLNVLEHIKDHNQALLNMHALLKPGGKLFLLVPQYESLYGTYDKKLGHYRRYSKNELKRVVGNCGLDIKHFQNFNFFGILGWFINARVFKTERMNSSQIKIFDTMVPLFKIIERTVPLPGLSLFCIAEKPL